MLPKMLLGDFHGEVSGGYWPGVVFWFKLPIPWIGQISRCLCCKGFHEGEMVWCNSLRRGA